MAQQQGVAIVTGSARGIGEAIALRLADDGYDISLNDIPGSQKLLETLAAKIRSKGRKAILAIGDVSVEKDVKRMVETTVKQLGGVDAMIANAGIFQAGPFVDTTVDNFEKLFAVNVRGTYLCFRYAAQQMIKQGRGGRLVAASSVVGVTGEAFVSLYGATKWAVRGIVLSTAKELGKYNITANAYAPGIINSTPMWQTAKIELAKAYGLQPENAEYVDEGEKGNSAVGYLGTPEDVANLVSFIVKKESHFITGQTLSVNGGRFVQ